MVDVATAMGSALLHCLRIYDSGLRTLTAPMIYPGSVKPRGEKTPRRSRASCFAVGSELGHPAMHAWVGRREVGWILAPGLASRRRGPRVDDGPQSGHACDARPAVHSLIYGVFLKLVRDAFRLRLGCWRHARNRSLQRLDPYSNHTNISRRTPNVSICQGSLLPNRLEGSILPKLVGVDVRTTRQGRYSRSSCRTEGGGITLVTHSLIVSHSS